MRYVSVVGLELVQLVVTVLLAYLRGWVRVMETELAGKYRGGSLEGKIRWRGVFGRAN